MHSTTTQHEFQVGDWVSTRDIWGGDPWIGEIISRDGQHPSCWRVEYEVDGHFVVNVESESELTFLGTERPDEGVAS